MEERRGRTRDLLFGDGLNNPSSNDQSSTGAQSRSKSRSKSPVNSHNSSTTQHGKENDVFIASGSAAQAALWKQKKRNQRICLIENNEQLICSSGMR